MKRGLVLVAQRDTVKAASEFASRNHLPHRIQDQMLSHICLRFKTEGLKQQETLNDLPKAIRSSIAHHLFFPVVQKVYLFQGVSHDFLFQLVHVFFVFIIVTFCLYFRPFPLLGCSSLSKIRVRRPRTNAKISIIDSSEPVIIDFRYGS